MLMSRFCVGELGRGDDLVGERQDQLGELRLVELGLAQLVEIVGGIEHGVVADQVVGEARQRALADAVGVVGLLQRVHEPAQVVVGVVGDVGRHLRVAEVGLCRPRCAVVRSARIRCVLPAPDWPWNSRMRVLRAGAAART